MGFSSLANIFHIYPHMSHPDATKFLQFLVALLSSLNKREQNILFPASDLTSQSLVPAIDFAITYLRAADKLPRDLPIQKYKSCLLPTNSPEPTVMPSTHHIPTQLPTNASPPYPSAFTKVIINHHPHTALCDTGAQRSIMHYHFYQRSGLNKTHPLHYVTYMVFLAILFKSWVISKFLSKLQDSLLCKIS